MCDVLHFMFEEDACASSTAEQSEARDKVRSTIYRDLYKREYKYSASGRATMTKDIADSELYVEDEMPVPVDPAAKSSAFAVPPKPYIAPTSVSEGSRLPFGTGIDSPLG